MLGSAGHPRVSSYTFAAYSPTVVIISSAYITLYLVFTTFTNRSRPNRQFSWLDLDQRSPPCGGGVLDRTKLQENKCPATLKEPRANRYLAGYRNTPQLIGTCSSAWWCSLLCSRLESNLRLPPYEDGVLTGLNYRRFYKSFRFSFISYSIISS